MEKKKFIEELKKMLLEDLNTKGDISPNILKVKVLSQDYPGVNKDALTQAQSLANWLETYFTHCRHCARPIDKELATKLIDSLDYI